MNPDTASGNYVGYHTATLVAHLIKVLVFGVAAYGAGTVALLLLDGRCVAKGSGVEGCSAVRLHLAQFLPVYGSLLALLVGVVAGVLVIRDEARLEKVFSVDWLLACGAAFLSLLLH